MLIQKEKFSPGSEGKVIHVNLLILEWDCRDVMTETISAQRPQWTFR